MSVIKTWNLHYRRKNGGHENACVPENEVRYTDILNGIDLEIRQGEFLVLLGPNGSGKSTFAKQLNALLFPDEGSVLIDGQKTSAVRELWKLRKQCGMVMQNPDQQIVGMTVEEDVAFGPENLGIPSEEIRKTTDQVLHQVGMTEFRKSPAHQLSEGQKQRVVIASSIAMKPQCLILDEPTAMLDPSNRKRILELIGELHEKEKMTIMMITQRLEEIERADRVLVMDQGKLVLEGKPREILLQRQKLKEWKLALPPVSELAYRLYEKGVMSRFDLFQCEEFVAQYLKDTGIQREKKESNSMEYIKSDEKKISTGAMKSENEIILELRRVSFSYKTGRKQQVRILSDIDLSIASGEIIGLIGRTGSGKSTLIQLMNGLMKPDEGEIWLRGENVHARSFKRKKLRQTVGVVFQCPEQQLFDRTVIGDVMFGPLNQGMDREKAMQLAEESLQVMALEKSVFDQSPFELSGGEKRRVAIAGILAMNPEMIVLDEPTAGLDAASKRQVWQCLRNLWENNGKTMVIVSHDMEELAENVTRLLVLDHEKIVMDDPVQQVFGEMEKLRRMGLSVPAVTEISELLDRSGIRMAHPVIGLEEAVKILSAGQS